MGEDLTPNDEIHHEKIIWFDQDLNPDLPNASQVRQQVSRY
jgi:hypothetical protein